MPITSSEWNSGKVHSLERRIMDFLNRSENVDRAFSLQEIIRGLGYEMKIDDPFHLITKSDVQRALDNLVKHKYVEEKKIEGIMGKEIYYRSILTEGILGNKLKNLENF
jgi:hypothetical protein